MREFWVPFILRPLPPLPPKDIPIEIPPTKRPLGLYSIYAGAMVMLSYFLVPWQVSCEYGWIQRLGQIDLISRPIAAASFCDVEGLIAHWTGGDLTDKISGKAGMVHGAAWLPEITNSVNPRVFRVSGGYFELQTEGLPLGSEPRTLTLWFRADSFTDCSNRYRLSSLAGYGNLSRFQWAAATKLA